MSISVSRLPGATMTEDKIRLYQAQSIANQVVKSNLFPCYSTQYINNQSGIKKVALQCYSVIYTAIEKLVHLVKQAYAKVMSMNDRMLEKAFQSLQKKIEPVLNAVYPINPINGERQFVVISRKIEKALGEHVFYPLSTKGMEESHERLHQDDAETIAAKVNRVVESLKNANGNLLNPPGETPFNYQIKTIKSTQINAFATPGGGMVIFSELVRKIQEAIETNKFKTTTVTFADGSTATVSLEGLTLEDALAAVLGHEITHSASRDSIGALMARGVNTILVNIARYGSLAYLKNSDKEYKELKAKPTLTQAEVQRLFKKERFFDGINAFFRKVGEVITHLLNLVLSRTNEHKADTTGIWFAHQAGYNPLGALLLQEILKDSETGFMGELHEKLPFLFSHPCSKDRNLSNFAAIQAIAPESLKGRVAWNINANSKYDVERSGVAVQYARAAALV